MHFLKKGQKIQAWVDPPPLIRAMPERKCFFLLMSTLTSELAKGNELQGRPQRVEGRTRFQGHVADGSSA